MVFASGPVGVKLVAQLAIFLLLVGLLDEGVLQQLRPRESLAGRLVQQTLQERLELWRHVVGELHRIFHDQVDQRVDTVRIKRRCAHEELVNDDTEGPEVDRVVVGELLDEFRCHVEGSSLDGGQHNCVGRHRAGKSKVAKLHYPIRRNQNVLRLHVSVDNSVGVQIVESLDELLSDFADLRLTKVAVVL